MLVLDAVLYGAQPQVLAFMRTRLPAVPEFGPCAAFGIVRNGDLIGGVVFNNWHPGGRDIELSIAVDTAAWFRPRTLRRIFDYPFHGLDCTRVTVRTGRRNKRARAAAEACGFRLEGVQRRALDGIEDRFCYGLLRPECRYLSQEPLPYG